MKISELAHKALIMNYVVSYQDSDGFSYMEYRQLKKKLSRDERRALLKALSQPKYNERGILNWYISNLNNPLISQVVAV